MHRILYAILRSRPEGIEVPQRYLDTTCSFGVEWRFDDTNNTISFRLAKEEPK